MRVCTTLYPKCNCTMQVWCALHISRCAEETPSELIASPDDHKHLVGMHTCPCPLNQWLVLCSIMDWKVEICVLFNYRWAVWWTSVDFFFRLVFRISACEWATVRTTVLCACGMDFFIELEHDDQLRSFYGTIECPTLSELCRAWMSWNGKIKRERRQQERLVVLETALFLKTLDNK